MKKQSNGKTKLIVERVFSNEHKENKDLNIKAYELYAAYVADRIVNMSGIDRSYLDKLNKIHHNA